MYQLVVWDVIFLPRCVLTAIRKNNIIQKMKLGFKFKFKRRCNKKYMAAYQTKQREMIWNYLIESDDKHITADEILHYLKSQDTPVGKSTIYRYLDLLEKQGKLRKYSGVESESACYQVLNEKEECRSHHHLICKICGKFIHLECSYLDEMRLHIKEKHKFRIDSMKTVFYGTCVNCL